MRGMSHKKKGSQGPSQVSAENGSNESIKPDMQTGLPESEFKGEGGVRAVGIFRYREYAVALLLAVVCLGIYWQVGGHEFIYFDDRLYVTENRYVLRGLSWENVKWAFGFSGKDQPYWHPLTWLSHMADVQVFGLDSGIHHLVNVLFHAMNVVLLFFVLRLMTGGVWKSGFVAALFALHPVNVDTVAWVAERKNLLSTFFWLLVMLNYYFYTRRPGVARYGVLVGVFVLGLLSKPMLITLPFVLLLLDYWPLGRIRFGQEACLDRTGIEGRDIRSVRELFVSPAVLDKIPLIVLSLVSVYVSMYSLRVGESGISLQAVPLGLRLENAIVSYAGYLKEALWPFGLAPYYPYPQGVPLLRVIWSLVLLISVTAGVVRFGRRMPYLMVGWLWFLGTLVPVSGLVQAGLWPAMADRWAYVPFIGLFIMGAWWVPELVKSLSARKEVLAASAAAVLLALALLTSDQLEYWKNTVSLFTHALSVTGDNDVVAFGLGVSLMKEGKLEPAKEYLTRALKMNPNSFPAHNDLGLILSKQGDIPGGIEHFRKAIELSPKFAEAYNNLATLLIKMDKLPEATKILARALEIDPEYGEAYSNMGLALARQGRVDDAVRYLDKAARLSPYSASVYFTNGMIMAKLGRMDDAMRYFEGAARIDPSSEEAHVGMGLVSLKRRDGYGAVEHFRQALQINPNNKIARMYLQEIMAAGGQSSDSQMQ
jgi:tetratricopeptide (TPR) repeat protein